MDVVKDVPRRFNGKIYYGICIILVSAFFYFIVGAGDVEKVDANSVITDVVKKGDLTISVSGYGVLRSNKQTLLTAQTSATVQEILLRPGAEVEPTTVLIKLSDPELDQDIESAVMALTEQEANLRRLPLSSKRELLSEESAIALLNAEYKAVQLRRIAEQTLAERGVVPAINFQTVLLQEQQLKERISLQQDRIQQLKQVHAEDLNISREQFNQAKSVLQKLELRRDRLTVRAGITGVLQKLPLELGQSVIAGQELALVGSREDLQALIRVPQTQAENIKLGQSATINTRREVVEGIVTRITPQVQDGTIEIELAFKNGVPESARPELNVDAKIDTNIIENALYIERPVNVHSNSMSSVFVMDVSSNAAILRDIAFGNESETFIHIIDGAVEGDVFVLSDMKKYSKLKEIKIIN